MRLALALAVCGLLLQGCEHVSSLPVIPDASVSSGWTVLSAGTLNLNAVSGVSDTAVWVVGDQGSIQYWNGTQLVSENSGTKVTLRGVWAVDMNTVYAVGDGGTILSRQAGVWQQVGVGVTPQVLTAVWADSMRVVAVGSNGTVVAGSAAAAYKVLPNADAENLLGVTGTPGGVVTAVGSLGLVLQINGTTLTRVPIPSFTKVLAGATTGPTATFFVGQQGSVYSSTAGGLQSLTGCPQTALRAASAIESTTWIVGWDGTICSITGASAASYPYTDTRWFNGVYAASPTALWVVGASGTLLHGLPSTPPAAAGSPEGGVATEGGAGDGGP